MSCPRCCMMMRKPSSPAPATSPWAPSAGAAPPPLAIASFQSGEGQDGWGGGMRAGRGGILLSLAAGALAAAAGLLAKLALDQHLVQVQL